MTVEQWQTLSLVAFILAGVFLVTAFVLFFVFRIPHVVGYLTGRTAKKAIAQIEAKNGNMEEDAKEIQERYNMNFQQSESGHLASVTETLDLNETVLLKSEKKSEETTLLKSTVQSEETTLLQGVDRSQKTEILKTEQNAGETTLLQHWEEETTELYPDENTGQTDSRNLQIEFQLIRDIIFIHSQEII